MTVTIGLWIVPLILSLIWLGVMNRPYERVGAYDVGPVFRIFWVIPILATWLVYFIVIYFMK